MVEKFHKSGYSDDYNFDSSKATFCSLPLLVGGGTFVFWLKPGDQFGWAERGQVKVKVLEDGGGSAAAHDCPVKKPANRCTGVVLLETHCVPGNWFMIYQITLWDLAGIIICILQASN